jgi:thiamine biosynthesis lipoprotein
MRSRRRFISILSACGALAPLARAGIAGGAVPGPRIVWKGIAMGALASMTLVHPDRARAQATIRQCVLEIDRLESIFSLYRPGSALSRLNAKGESDDAPQELIELLSFALALAKRSDGAFDPTVQPLYRLYADHFARPAAPAGGPPAEAIDDVLRLVDFSAVRIDAGRIRLRRPGMAITLNGVAQGFVTDRIADLLRRAGFDDVLIDLGEARALGQRPEGGPWRAALADPLRPARTLLDLPLGEAGGAFPALATSAGYGTRFGPDPRIHHLLDPHTGRSAQHHASVSVAAPRAALADGLSTALSVIDPSRAARLLAWYGPLRAYFVDDAGQVRVHAASG